MDSISTNSLQPLEELSSTQTVQNSGVKPSSNEFENLLSDVNTEYLTATLSLNSPFNISDFLEVSKEVDDANAEVNSKTFEGLETQRSSNIQNNANIMKALLSI